MGETVIYTGAIDAFYDYALGKLEYRTVRFETEVLDTDNYQGVAVVNYTDRETPYTRVIEHRKRPSFPESIPPTGKRGWSRTTR